MVDQHVQEIIDWRESMALFSEENFFELVRTYLGPIQTPYNKQKLVEELGAFLKNASNREKMLLMLDDDDRTILSAVSLIADCTSSKLAAFFSGVYAPVPLFEHLVSLEERLFIYSRADKRLNKKIISIVPYMKDIVSTFASLDKILSVSEAKTVQEAKSSRISQSLIACLISYIAENSDVCKADGTLKKKAATAFAEIFPSFSEDEINSLVCNTILSLFSAGVLKENPDSRRSDGNYVVDFEKATALSRMPPDLQYAVLCSSRVGATRSEMQEFGELLISALALLPKSEGKGFTKNTLMKAFFLINEKNHEREVFRRGESRFALMLSSRDYGNRREKAESEESAFVRRAQVAVDAAISLGVLQKIGEDENGESVFSAADVSEPPESKDGKVLSVDAGFSVTIMPGLSLEKLLPMMKILSVKRFDTASVFELSKESAMRGFAGGLTGESLLAALEVHSMYPLPQNVRSCVEEWFSSYNSASLFKGYILQVAPEKEVLVEGNPKIARHVLKKLAPGVFFMDFAEDTDADVALIRSRLDYIAKIDPKKPRSVVVPYPMIKANPAEFVLSEKAGARESEKEKTARENYLKELEDSVMSKRMDSDKRGELISRIHRRLISNPAQLSPESVRIEKLEAGAMDYFGKIHVIEHTISTKSMLEIECDGETIAGKPAALEKRGSEAILTLVCEPEKNSRNFSVSSLLHVKRIHSSLFFFAESDDEEEQKQKGRSLR